MSLPQGSTMMNNIKIIKPLPSLSSTQRVKPTDHRQNNNQQSLFKKTFKERQKKNKTKEDPMHDNISGGGATTGIAQQPRHAVTNVQSKDSSHKKNIDIRV